MRNTSLLIAMLIGCHLPVAGQISVKKTAELNMYPSSVFTTIHDQRGHAYLYSASKESGLHILDFSDPQSLQLIDTIPITQLNNLEVMNLSQQGDYLFLALGNFFAAGTQPAGMAIIDISNPQQATVTDIWRSTDTVKGSAIVITQGSYAYLGAMNDGVIILDFSNKNDIRFVSKILPDPDYPIKNPSAAQTPNARGMAVRNDTLFVCNDAGGIRLIDVSDKNQPKEIAMYVNPVMKDKPRAYNNITLRGNLAYVAVDYCGMEILDISDAANITEVGWFNPWECETGPLNWFSSPGHTNQVELMGWENLTLLSAGDAEFVAVDVSNPQQPDSATGFGQPKNNQGAWGTAFFDKHIFLSYIRTLGIPFASTWGGVKVLEMQGISSGQETHKSELTSLSIAPNPMGKENKLKFALASSQWVDIRLHDVTGREIKQIFSGQLHPGTHQFTIDAASLSPTGAVFLCVIESTDGLQTLKLIRY